MTRQAGTELAPELPNNIEAERAILGGILAHNPALDIAAEKIVPDDFLHINHRRIYQAMLALHEDEKAIDTVTLLDYLAKEKWLDAAGGPIYVGSLLEYGFNSSNISFHADIVQQKSRLRKLIKQTEYIQLRAFEGSATVDSLEGQFKEAIESTALAENGNGNGNGHLGTSLIDFLKRQFPPQEHLIEKLIPANASVMIYALPHRLKSFLTIGLTLGASNATDKLLGKLVVPRPVRTMLVQVEDPDAIFQKRVADIVSSTQFLDVNHENVWIVPRGDFTGFTKEWAKRLVKQAQSFKADIIILDVLRRLFAGHGDINSMTDSAIFLEMLDAIKDITGATIVIVHHENKKDADLMTASAGSINFTGWANVVIQIKRKTMNGNVTQVELEVDNKVGESMEPMRMVLDLSSPTPIRLEGLEEGDGLTDALADMDNEWNVRTLCEVMGIHRTSASRRIKAWLAQGKIIKLKGGKKGRTGGLAVYSAAGLSSD